LATNIDVGKRSHGCGEYVVANVTVKDSKKGKVWPAAVAFGEFNSKRNVFRENASNKIGKMKKRIGNRREGEKSAKTALMSILLEREKSSIELKVARARNRSRSWP
jgi:hypothetical protein